MVDHEPWQHKKYVILILGHQNNHFSSGLGLNSDLELTWVVSNTPIVASYVAAVDILQYMYYMLRLMVTIPLKPYSY